MFESRKRHHLSRPPFTVGWHVSISLGPLGTSPGQFVQITDQDAIAGSDAPAPRATSICEQLETARALIETRFSDAGGRLAGSLDMVGRLIESLDELKVALNAESVSRTTEDLLATADGLTALPGAQRGRVDDLERLSRAGSALGSHIDEMRQTLRYLRAFALNVKITAGATISASDEFAGFAERMCDQLDLGGGQLDQLAEQLTQLGAQLAGALAFERGLGGKYQSVIPAVPDKLAVDARAIGLHHARIAEMAGSVAAIARDIQMKVARALTALQIGDITRQRIEHVQFGLAVAARTLAHADLAAEAKERVERRLMHLLAEQMADTASDFEAEAAKVTQSLAGMAEDTAQILAVQGLSDARSSGGLRDLEVSLGQAGALVGDVGAAMSNAQRISGETVSAVEALTRRVDAIQGVKRDIQQMAINSSLRCNRLGEIGKPLNVIALELSSHAGQLEEAADQTLGSLTALAAIAGDMEANTARADAGAVDPTRLDEVRERLRQAADVVEHDLADLSRQGEATASSLALAADQLGLKEDLGDALHTAAIALADAAGPAVEGLADIVGVLGEALDEIARCYTMARERTIHAAHALGAVGGEPDTPGVPAVSETAPPVAEEFDDILF